MSHETISVRAKDGDCPVHVFTPKGGTDSPAGSTPGW